MAFLPFLAGQHKRPIGLSSQFLNKKKEKEKRTAKETNKTTAAQVVIFDFCRLSHTINLLSPRLESQKSLEKDAAFLWSLRLERTAEIQGSISSTKYGFESFPANR